MRACRKFPRSAALSQKAALQMPFPSMTPPVKMRLERSAERNKREILNNNSAEYAQSARGAHSKSFSAYAHPLFCVRKVWYTENSILCPEGG